MPNYVYSTSSNDTIFVRYQKSQGGKPALAQAHVTIKGKANVAQGRVEFITKQGIRTEVSDEELSILNESSNFKKMCDAGFMRLEQRKANPEKVAQDMAARDRSAPLTPDNYSEDDLAKPVATKSAKK